MSLDTPFPRIHEAVPTDVLTQVFEQAPARIAQALAGLSDQEVGQRARGANRWSIGEIVCHLADSELIGACRFRIVRTQPNTEMPVYDPDVFAGGFGYRERDRSAVNSALELFTALRASTTHLMRQWTTDDWQIRGQHPEWGPLTLRQLLELYADHGEKHLDQILDNRTRQHKSVALRSLLTGRFAPTTSHVPAADGAL